MEDYKKYSKFEDIQNNYNRCFKDLDKVIKYT